MMNYFRRNIVILLIAATFIQPVAGQLTTDYIGKSQLYYGVAYYPEVWDFQTVDEDIRWMKSAGINVVRMGEFSWNLMEPMERQFSFDWLLKIINRLHEEGIDVILGTPTATPPSWLATTHPEIFRITADGRQLGHGARRNTSYTSKTYRMYCRIICEQIASAVGNHPGVIAWQTDNEFHISPDYSEESEKAWHNYLKRRYVHIDSLNALWRTHLWSQEYQAFEQVPMDDGVEWHHPSLRMDWLKFCSDQVVEFQDIQLRAIRKHSDIPITHDGMPGQKIEYPDLFRDLDFMATNFYHNFTVYNRVQGNFDRMRGYGKGMHWVFETAPNYSGGGREGKNWFIHQPPGSVRAILWSHYALGGQGTMFWLWRQHPAGQEMPHGSFISAWGEPVANFEELSALGQELSRYSDLLMNARVEAARTAIYYSHTADRGFSIEQNSSENIRYYTDWTARFYRPLSDAFIHRDVIHESVDISQYKLLIMPMMPVIPPVLRAQLSAWVKNGGILILGPMTGFRSAYWTAFTSHAMGEFGKWTGISVDTRIPTDPYNDRFTPPASVQLTSTDSLYRAGLWSEALSADGGKVIATYSHGVHDGKNAIIEHPVGEGKVVLLGCDPGYENMRSLYLKYAKHAGITPLASGDKDVVAVKRITGDKEYLILINLTNLEKTITPAVPLMKDLITGERMVDGALRMDPFQVIIAVTDIQ